MRWWQISHKKEIKSYHVGRNESIPRMHALSAIDVDKVIWRRNWTSTNCITLFVELELKCDKIGYIIVIEI